MRRIGATVLGALQCGTALAQQGSSYGLSAHVLNLSGHPHGGVVLASASYRITLDAVGDAVNGGLLSGTSYRPRGGFIWRYLPPGETHGVRFITNQHLIWDPKPSVGTYNLYHRASDVGGPGSCFQNGITTETFTITQSPTSGVVHQYLVAAVDLLAEEGTWGPGRSPSAACP